MNETGLIILLLVVAAGVGTLVWWAMRRSQPRKSARPVAPAVLQTMFGALPTTRLLCINGPEQGAIVEIRGKQIRFGRNPKCEVRVEDPLVSWEHALLTFDAKSKQYVLYDQDSTNGTWVNNQRIAQRTIALGSDQIRIGPAVFVVRLGDQPVPTPTPLPLHKSLPVAVERVHRLKEYEKLKELGRGGSSVVYKARSRRDGRIVAIKMLTHADPYMLTKFKSEGGVIPQLLRHRHILRVYGLGEVPQTKQPYIVMEYISGGTLRDVLRPGSPLSMEQIVMIAGQICDALQYAHRKGVYHRDLKPENVFFATPNTTKLGDFGIARLAQSVTRTASGYLLGTPQYMSYEQARGIPDIDGRCDIYALGVMLYEMVTGYPPFRADNPLTVVDKHLKERPTPPRQLVPQVPQNIEMVIMRALEKDRDLRFQTAEELARALGYTAPMNGDGVPPSAPSRGERSNAIRGEKLTLVCSDGAQFLLTDKGLNLGRANLSPNDGELSRQHAAIVYRDGVYWVEDRNSTNGTFVNGQRIFNAHPLQEGDRIQLGNTSLYVARR